MSNTPENPNELTIENSVLVLIDHQPAIALSVHSIDQGLLIDNVAGLARAAKDLDVPTVLTTIGAQGSVLVDPIFKEISDVFPEVTPIDRPSSNAWSHPDVRAAVEATGRKKLIIAGLTTEVCLAQSSLSAIKDGFDVYFVTDCSGGVSTEAHESAKVRLMMAGAKPITWAAVTAEWAPYWASPEAATVSGAYAGSAALLTDYVTAQLTAGVVSPPDFLSVPAQAGATSDQP
jgi:nicotinamidase-related amidase